MKKLWVLGLALALGGTAVVVAATVPALAQKVATTPDSFVEKKNSPARGNKTCTIRQKHGGGTNIQIRVYPNGTVGIGVREDMYPGTSTFFLINGKRYSGSQAYYVSLDSAAITALQRQSPIDYSWNDWPYKTEHNQKTIVARFSELFSDCKTFYSSR